MKGKIKNPCPVSWDSMKKTEDITQRFCTSCDKIVHNITQLQPAEIRDLYEENQGNLCVQALSTQINTPASNRQTWKKWARNARVISAIAIGGLLGNPATAQHIIRQPDTYKIQQEDNTQREITIKGKIKVEKFLRWRRIEKFLRWGDAQNITVTIYTEDGLQVCEITDPKNNEFETTLDRAILGEKFTIAFWASDSKTLTVKDVQVKDSNFTVYLEEKIWQLGGRFLY